MAVEGQSQNAETQEEQEKDEEKSSQQGRELSREEGLNIEHLERLVEYIEEHDPKKIICMIGAGLSTAAGIPDFRSPGTGLYDNLQRYNLPQPEAVFDLGFFAESPEAFYDLAKELWPTGKKYQPTSSHYFLRMLEQQGRLLRCYSQNIDMLESLAGLSPEKVVAAHGNFEKAHALNGEEVPIQELEAAVFAGIDACRALEEKYGALVKPDIVFFGEGLPKRFFECAQADFPECDLLIVMGTSLAVGPFNRLIMAPEKSCPRVLINRDQAGLATPCEGVSFVPRGFQFLVPPERDIFLRGDCDEVVRQLCACLGWTAALEDAARGASAPATDEAASTTLSPASPPQDPGADAAEPPPPASEAAAALPQAAAPEAAPAAGAPDGPAAKELHGSTASTRDEVASA